MRNSCLATRSRARASGPAGSQAGALVHLQPRRAVAPWVGPCSAVWRLHRYGARAPRGLRARRGRATPRRRGPRRSAASLYLAQHASGSALFSLFEPRRGGGSVGLFGRAGLFRGRQEDGAPLPLQEGRGLGPQRPRRDGWAGAGAACPRAIPPAPPRSRDLFKCPGGRGWGGGREVAGPTRGASG